MSVIKRSFAIGAVLLATLSMLAGNAFAVTLRTNSVIEDNVIRLGDLFDNLPVHADKVLGPAPMPGSDMVLNARTLMKIAVALDLPWRPASTADQVTLTRAATVIGKEQIAQTIKDRLIAQGVQGEFNLVTNGQDTIILPAGQPAVFEITALDHVIGSDTFSADIAAPSAQKPSARLRVSGQLEKLVSVPVLKSAIRNGDVINADDISLVTIPEKALKNDIVLNMDDLVGMTPRRMQTAGQPVKADELVAPRLVSRGESITLMFRSGPLQLTAQGKSMEDGAKGQIIRVVNTTSNKTLQAEITAPGQAEIRTF